MAVINVKLACYLQNSTKIYLLSVMADSKLDEVRTSTFSSRSISSDQTSVVPSVRSRMPTDDNRVIVLPLLGSVLVVGEDLMTSELDSQNDDILLRTLLFVRMDCDLNDVYLGETRDE